MRGRRRRVACAIALVAFAILGCGGDRVVRVGMPDGQVWFRTRCRHHNDCVQNAMDRCERGFYEYKGDGAAKDAHSTDHELLFRCKTKLQSEFSE